MQRNKNIKINCKKQPNQENKDLRASIVEAKNCYEKANNITDFEQAIVLLSKAISKSPQSQMVHLNNLYNMRGICYIQTKNFFSAEKDFQQAISISDDKGKILFYISWGKCKMEHSLNVEDSNKSQVLLQESAGCFEKALEYSIGQSGEGYFNLGIVYKKMKKNFKAIKQFEKALQNLKYFEQFQVYIQKAICYRQIGQIQNSIDDLLKACEIKKDDAICHFNLGINYIHTQKYDQALEEFTISIDINKNQPKYHNYKALTLYMSGHYEQCLNIFQQTLKLYKQHESNGAQIGQCWYNTGNALLNLSRNDQALQAFTKTQQYQMNSEMQIKVLYAVGRVYENIKDIRSIQKFQKCLNLIGQNTNNQLFLSTFFHLGINQYKNQRQQEAINSFTSILEMDCRDSCVYQERGKAYLKNQNYHEALKDFQAVATFSDNYADVYYFRGLCKTYLGQVDSAINDLFKAIELNCRENGVYNGLSLAYLMAKKLQKALIYSNISLQKQPSNEQFLIQRSKIYLELQQYQKGVDDLTQALIETNQNPVVFYQRGLTYYKNKQFKAAIKDLQKSLDCNPNRNIKADIYYHIGISYACIQQYNSSIQALTKAIELQPLAKYFHERAKNQLLTNRNQLALNDLNQVIKLQPDNAFSYFRRALAFKALKMYEEAAQDFFQARQLAPQDPRLIINKNIENYANPAKRGELLNVKKLLMIKY